MTTCDVRDDNLRAVEAEKMVSIGLAAMSEEEKRKILTAFMTGQCIVFPKNYSLTEIEALIREFQALYAIFGDKAETKAIYGVLMEMLNTILKGLGRMEYARNHHILDNLDLWE